MWEQFLFNAGGNLVSNLLGGDGGAGNQRRWTNMQVNQARARDINDANRNRRWQLQDYERGLADSRENATTAWDRSQRGARRSERFARAQDHRARRFNRDERQAAQRYNTDEREAAQQFAIDRDYNRGLIARRAAERAGFNPLTMLGAGSAAVGGTGGPGFAGAGASSPTYAPVAGAEMPIPTTTPLIGQTLLAGPAYNQGNPLNDAFNAGMAALNFEREMALREAQVEAAGGAGKVTTRTAAQYNPGSAYRPTSRLGASLSAAENNRGARVPPPQGFSIGNNFRPELSGATENMNLPGVVDGLNQDVRVTPYGVNNFFGTMVGPSGATFTTLNPDLEWEGPVSWGLSLYNFGNGVFDAFTPNPALGSVATPNGFVANVKESFGQSLDRLSNWWVPPLSMEITNQTGPVFEQDPTPAPYGGR